MKKALLIGLAVGLAVALAAPAFAIDWSARGEIAIMGAYYKNIDKSYPVAIMPLPYAGEPTTSVYGGVLDYMMPGSDEENAWVQLRTVLVITARASENLAGIWAFEIDSGRWGEDGSMTTSIGTGAAGQWNADAIAVEVKSCLIEFKVPQTPVVLRAGIQNFQVRPHMFLLLDGAGVTARAKFNFDPVTLGFNAFWGKMYEGVDHTQADDQDLYGIDMSIGVGNIKGGAFFAYQALRQAYDGTAYVEGDDMRWWLGAYSDIKVGPVGATLDFIYNGGQADFQGASPVQDIDFEGWVIRGELTYILNKFKFGMGGLYGSGDDRATAEEYEGYTVPLNSEACFFNKDFVILTGDWGLFNPYGNAFVGGLFKPRSNIGEGVWYVRGFMDYQVLSWLKLMANFGYIGDTSENWDTFGRDASDDDSIGWELDLGAQFQIYPNLYFNTTFGYMWAGDAFDEQTGGNNINDPWAWISTLTFIF